MRGVDRRGDVGGADSKQTDVMALMMDDAGFGCSLMF